MNTTESRNCQNAKKVSHCLKGLAHETRLMLLMGLKNGEKGVNELVDLTGYPQPTVSQHLSKMKERGLLDSRRDGTQIFYFIKDKRLFGFMDLLRELFCK